MSITDEPDGGEDTSEAEAVEVIEDLGIGFGGEVVARDTLSRGLAPLDGKVRLKRSIIRSLCANFRIFLSIRFYAISILESLEVLKMSFLPLLGLKFC